MSDANTQDDHEHSIGHISPIGALIGVFALLIFFTVLTVAVTYVDLGPANVWIALGVAVVKATLVGLYFMHLRYDSPFNSLILVSAFLFLALFIGILLMDTEAYQPRIEARNQALATEVARVQRAERIAQAAAAAQEVAASAAVTVTISDLLQFEPKVVTIKAGQKVVWYNKSALKHTVTADPSKAANLDHVLLPDGAEPFDSDLIMPQDTYERTFTVSGRYRYFCIPHEATGMVGEVIVEPSP